MTAAWRDARELVLDGMRLTLSRPVLVGRRQGYFWFPQVVGLPNGDLVALASPYADEHRAEPEGAAAFSRDGGLTWGESVSYRHSSYLNLVLDSGDLLLLPYYMYPRPGGMGAPCNVIPLGSCDVRAADREAVVTGWPRPDRGFSPELGLSGFVFNGQTVRLTDGRFLGTVYGRFQDEDRCSLLTTVSADGFEWAIHSVVADARCALDGREGPSEAAMCRLRDGRLMCVFRVAGGNPYGQSFSRDEGRTWGEATAMDAFSVEPSLVAMADGSVLLSGGRPGVFLWVNADGAGDTWGCADIREHHNTCIPDEPIPPKTAATRSCTSSYTEIIALDDEHLLLVYDRIPHSWGPIPEDSDETNSVWVVRVRARRL